MRSAYLVLGVPGDASPEEIEAAFRKAERLYPRERLAQEEGALVRLGELKSAYQVLRDPQSRAAHDRKLQQAVVAPMPRTVVVQVEESSPGRRMMVAAFWLVGLLFVVGAVMSWRSAEARKEQAALELAAQKAAEQAAARQHEAQERLVRQRAAMAAESQANEQRLAYETRISMQQAAANARSQEANRQNEDRRAASEARMRVERDKQRVRELCLQVYRRPDC